LTKLSAISFSVQTAQMSIMSTWGDLNLSRLSSKG